MMNIYFGIDRKIAKKLSREMLLTIILNEN